MKIIKKVLQDIIITLIRVSSRKNRNRKSLLFIPHFNSLTDGYDMVNYKSDNALCLFNSIINDSRYSDFDIGIMCYDKGKIASYKDYISHQSENKNVKFIVRENFLQFIRVFFNYSVLFTDYSHQIFEFKDKNQKLICLNYFTPFKDDYFFIKDQGIRNALILEEKVNKNIDYLITTSDISSRIMANDVPISLSKCLPLGFPRNDMLYEKTDIVEKLKQMIQINFNYIICYTPTYRDYERVSDSKHDSALSNKKNILGTDKLEDLISIQRYLEDTNGVLFYKLHPLQERSILIDNKLDRIVNMTSVFQSLTTSLYEILSVTDLLITDYTSTSFDFLHRNKPIIYYFYDYDKYIKTRGFSFDPIDAVCGGPIAYSFDELQELLVNTDNWHDDYSAKLNWVHTYINKYHDNKSSERIKKLIDEII